jgi:sensor domain CHASE-containing protein
MIKFFRRIRQQLLSENKFSKYLLYAIGEIILVVIGILIALQINNNNNYNEQRKIEREYLI